MMDNKRRSRSRELAADMIDPYGEGKQESRPPTLTKEIVDWMYSGNAKYICLDDERSNMKKVDIRRVSSSKCTVTTRSIQKAKERVEKVETIYEELNGLALEWIVEKQSGLIFCEKNGKEYSVLAKDIVAADTPGLRPNSEVRFFVHWTFSDDGETWIQRTSYVTLKDGSPIPFNHPWEEDMENLAELKQEIKHNRIRGMVWNWKLSKSKGFVFPLSLKCRPIPCKASDIVAKGRKQLKEFSLVDFYVEIRNERAVAVEIGFPCEISNRVEPLIFETGEDRKYVLKFGTAPKKNKKRFGLVRKWDMKTLRGIIIPEDGSTKVHFTEKGVKWSTNAEKKVPLWIRVQYSLIKEENGRRSAISIMHPNGEAIGKPKAELVAQTRNTSVMFIEMDTLPAPDPPAHLSVLHHGTVISWSDKEQRGYIESPTSGRVVAVAEEIQTDCVPIRLDPGRKVDFFVYDNRAAHITGPGNTIYSTPAVPSRGNCGKYVCELCNLSLSSQKTLDTHLAGKSHRKRKEQQKMARVIPQQRKVTERELKQREWEGEMVEEEPGTIYVDPSSQYFCAYCICDHSSLEEFKAHTRTSSHKYQERLAGGRIITVLPQLPRGYLYRCGCCKKKMLTGENWNKHVRGKQHKHKAAMAKLNYQGCELCGVEFTSAQHMRDHFTGKRHRNAVRDNGGEDPHYDWSEGLDISLEPSHIDVSVSDCVREEVGLALVESPKLKLTKRRRRSDWDATEDWRMEAPVPCPWEDSHRDLSPISYRSRSSRKRSYSETQHYEDIPEVQQIDYF